MQNKLISMVDFVRLMKNDKDKDNNLRFGACDNYANFLSQKLEIWQFIPCKLVNGVWVVLKEPLKESFDLTDMYDWNLYTEDLKEYKEAKLLCLFEIHSLEEETEDYWYFGLDEFTMICVTKTDTIEDLAKCNLKLTDTAKIS